MTHILEGCHSTAVQHGHEKTGNGACLGAKRQPRNLLRVQPKVCNPNLVQQATVAQSTQEHVTQFWCQKGGLTGTTGQWTLFSWGRHFSVATASMSTNRQHAQGRCITLMRFQGNSHKLFCIVVTSSDEETVMRFVTVLLLTLRFHPPNCLRPDSCILQHYYPYIFLFSFFTRVHERTCTCDDNNNNQDLIIRTTKGTTHAS